MGQLNEKAKQMLKDIGINELPYEYKKDQQQLYVSPNTIIKLTTNPVLLNPKQITTYFQNLKFRRSHPEYLIQIQFVDVKKYNQDYCKIVTYIEQQIISLPFGDMIIILYSALKGYQLLHQQYGYFTIESVMIGLNDAGETKVWLSRKYCQNLPKTSYSYAKLTQSQVSMVNDIKEIFKCKTEKKTIPNNFQLQNSTFINLITELQAKFGLQFLQSKVFLTNPNPQIIVQSRIVDGHTINTVNNQINESVGPQIRFNYRMNPHTLNQSASVQSQIHPMSANRNIASTSSKPKITFNGRSSVSVQPKQARSTSVKNISFNYVNNKPARQGSPIKDLVENQKDLYSTNTDPISNSLKPNAQILQSS